MANIKLTDPIRVAGVDYDSVRSACEALNKVEKFVVRRLNKGWDTDVAFGVKEGLTLWQSAITLNGVEYYDLRHACRELGKREKVILDRLKRNLDLETAFGFTKRTRNKETEVFGYTFDSLKDATIAFGVDYGRTSQRLTQYKYGKGSAFDLTDYNDTFEINGRVYPSLALAVEKEEVDIPTVYRRLRSGWTAEQAFGYERRGNCPAGRFELAGIIYQTLEDAVDNYGLEYWKVAYALDMGKDAEEVFGVMYKTPQRNIHYGDEEELTGYMYTRFKDAKAYPFYRGKRYATLNELKKELLEKGVFANMQEVYSRFGRGDEYTLGEITKVYERPKMSGEGVIFRDKHFPNLLSLCNYYDIGYASIQNSKRMNPKKKIDVFIEEAIKRKETGETLVYTANKIKYKNEVYANAKDMCNKLDLPYQTYLRHKRNRKDLSDKQIIDAMIAKRDKVESKVVLRKERAKKVVPKQNVLPHTSGVVEERLVNSQGRRDIVKNAKPEPSTGRRKYIKRREAFMSFCKENGFKMNAREGDLLLGVYASAEDFQLDKNLPKEVAFYSHNRGESLDRTIMYLLEKHKVNPNTRIENESGGYDTYTSLCRRYGVDVRLFSIRMHYGWTVEQSLGLVKKRVRKTNNGVFAYRGVLCISVSHITTGVFSSTSYVPPTDVSDVHKLDDFFGNL